MVHGEQFVPATGEHTKLKWPVDSWDSVLKVRRLVLENENNCNN